MARKLAGLLATGPSGNGKTTFFQLLKLLLKPKHVNNIVASIDMSTILMKWGMNQCSKLGTELREHFHLVQEGKLIPDWLVNKTFSAWYAEVVNDAPQLELLLLSGAPRSTDQLVLLNFFHHPFVININATRDQSDAAIFERLKKSGATSRVDDVGGQSVADQRWLEYETFTLPAISKLNGQGLHLDRSEPLETRLRTTLERMLEYSKRHGEPIPLRLLETGLNRLSCPNHPIHAEIFAIEHPDTI